MSEILSRGWGWGCKREITVKINETFFKHVKSCPSYEKSVIFQVFFSEHVNKCMQYAYDDKGSH